MVNTGRNFSLQKYKGLKGVKKFLKYSMYNFNCINNHSGLHLVEKHFCASGAVTASSCLLMIYAKDYFTLVSFQATLNIDV